jgi:hypothetical protein
MVEFFGGLAVGVVLTLGVIAILIAAAAEYASAVDERDLDFGFDPRTAARP